MVPIYNAVTHQYVTDADTARRVALGLQNVAEREWWHRGLQDVDPSAVIALDAETFQMHGPSSRNVMGTITHDDPADPFTPPGWFWWSLAALGGIAAVMMLAARGAGYVTGGAF